MKGSNSAHRRWVVALVVAVLTALAATPVGATVSGENGEVTFVRDGDIYVMGSDGSNPVNLTQNPALDDEPAWSPDGRRIAFVSDRDGDTAVFVMEADGSNVQRIGLGTSPGWSPDGTKIALERNGPLTSLPTSAIWVHTIGGSTTQITHPALTPTSPDWAIGVVGDVDPSWSPDGGSIVFIRKYYGGSPLASFAQLFIVRTDGSNLRQVPNVGSQHLASPDWDPGGARIAVVELWLQGLASQLVTVGVDGSNRVEVPSPPGHPDVFGVTWSPDGMSLAAGLGLINSVLPEVFKMDLDGSNPVNLTNNAGADRSPDWQALNPYPVGAVDPTTGMWYLRHANAAVTSFYYGVSGDAPFMGDWDCDGVETPGLYRSSDGFVYLRNTNTQGGADRTFFFGISGDVPVAGDFDGDGCDTVSVYRPSEGRFYIINELGLDGGNLGFAEYSYLFGVPGDTPIIGDWDGDGVDTPGLRRPSNGFVYLRNSNTTGFADISFFFGAPGDRPVAGDWDGDGKDTVGVFRPSNHTFYFRFTNTQGFADAQYMWGQSVWLPIAGDFD